MGKILLKIDLNVQRGSRQFFALCKGRAPASPFRYQMISNACFRKYGISIDYSDLGGSVLRAAFVEVTIERHARPRHQISACAVAKVRNVHEQIHAVAVVGSDEAPALLNTVGDYRSSLHL